MGKDLKYFAFISYKREDERWARWLHRKLESYRLPSVIAREKPDLPKKLNPVFRDTTDIKPGVLADVLTQNLKDSKYLIVICSPKAAKSEWIGKEISDFIEFGEKKNIILFIIEGKPYCNNPELECYHQVIKEKLPEMLGVNINEEGKEWEYIKKQKAFVRLVSTLLDVSFDELWQRQSRRIIHKLVRNILLILVFMATLGFVWKTNQPFDSTISIKEMTFHNSDLPFENGEISLCYDKDTLTKLVNNYNDKIVFRSIPGKFLNKNSSIRFKMVGFISIDTLISIQKSIELPIKRNRNTFGNVIAFLYDIYHEKIIEDAEIEILGYKITTNESGYFNLSIPFKEQQSKYFLKSNIHIIDSIIYMPTDSSVIIRVCK